MTYRSCPDHKTEPMDTCRVCARQAADTDHAAGVAAAKAALHATRDRAHAQEDNR